MALVLNSSSITGIGSGGLYAPGHVLQTVQGTTGSAVSTTSTSFVTTTLAATITPASTSSKVLVTVTLADVYNASVGQTGTFTVYRNGTNIAPSGSTIYQAFGLYWVNSTTPYQNNTNFSFLDSPASTSALTYTVYYSTAGGTLYVAINGLTSTIQLMEIAQ